MKIFYLKPHLNLIICVVRFIDQDSALLFCYNISIIDHEDSAHVHSVSVCLCYCVACQQITDDCTGKYYVSYLEYMPKTSWGAGHLYKVSWTVQSQIKWLLCLLSGADVGYVDNNTRRPLLYQACINEDEPVVKMLIKHWANPNQLVHWSIQQ